MQRDIVLRWLQTLSALVARLLRREPGVTLDLVRAQLDEAKAMLLGASLDALLERLEPDQAADLLNDPHRIYGYAQLLALESALDRADGRDTRAAEREARALVLARAALDRIDPRPEEWVEWLAALEEPRTEGANGTVALESNPGSPAGPSSAPTDSNPATDPPADPRSRP
ncbi:MAG: hypothetical protein AB7L66_17975 [Gemmatimonadales bacterium]